MKCSRPLFGGKTGVNITSVAITRDKKDQNNRAFERGQQSSADSGRKKEAGGSGGKQRESQSQTGQNESWGLTAATDVMRPLVGHLKENGVGLRPEDVRQLP